jgi:DNA modification methylase
MNRCNIDHIATASVNGTAVGEQTALIHETDAGLSSTSKPSDEVCQTREILGKDPPRSLQIRDRVKEFRRVRASELVRNPKNWRRHPKSQVAALRGLLSEIGYAAALLVRELSDGRLMIIDGHMRAATTPEQVVPVLVLDVTEEEADKILLTHDPLGAMAESDAARIKALLVAVQTEDQAVQDLLRHTAGEQLWAVLHPDQVHEAEISPSRADELRETWGVEPGQVWQAEAHRIVCGDSRERRNLQKLGAEPFRLIVTDPPYGVNYAAKNKYLNSSDRGTRIQKPIENDGLPPNEVKALFEASIKEALAFALPGAACYATVPSGPLLPFFIAAFEGAGLSFKHLLVWVKQQFVIGLSDYHYRHEAILYGWVENAPHYFIKDRTQDSVFEIDRPLVSDLHPTTKPVELLARMIANSSLPGEIIYDPFCGSGSTIVAAHQLGRVAHACEVDPSYVAVALERLAMLGLRPTLVR